MRKGLTCVSANERGAADSFADLSWRKTTTSRRGNKKSGTKILLMSCRKCQKGGKCLSPERCISRRLHCLINFPICFFFHLDKEAKQEDEIFPRLEERSQGKVLRRAARSRGCLWLAAGKEWWERWRLGIGICVHCFLEKCIDFGKQILHSKQRMPNKWALFGI